MSINAQQQFRLYEVPRLAKSFVDSCDSEEDMSPLVSFPSLRRTWYFVELSVELVGNLHDLREVS